MRISRDTSSSNRTTFLNGNHDRQTRTDGLIVLCGSSEDFGANFYGSPKVSIGSHGEERLHRLVHKRLKWIKILAQLLA